MDFKIIFCKIFCLFNLVVFSQHTLKGLVTDYNNKPIKGVYVFDSNSRTETQTNDEGFYQFKNLNDGKHQLIFFHKNYSSYEKEINIESDYNFSIELKEVQGLSQVEYLLRKEEYFNLKKLPDVDGTAIYAGKKTEVVLTEGIVGNVSSNNSRQIYSKVAGLNIYESSNCGLQLAIGGRGLDPNRTSNFNTRQNGYDISADVLGYPESYYTPPVEALEQIQIIRGAASLQYGTQFGGLINFVTKQPQDKPLDVITRNFYDSNCGYSNFTSLTGKTGKLGYYGYMNYRTNNDGPRPNTSLESVNTFIHLDYEFSPRTKLTGQFTRLYYTAQQPGGLNDRQFLNDPTFSNRTRNWFRVKWNLLSLRLDHEFKNDDKICLNISALDASRDAVGFRSFRATDVDEIGSPRELLKSEFRNLSTEFRYLNNYRFLGKKSVGLLGVKYYQSNNSEFQGPGTGGSDDNFSIGTDFLESFQNQSDFEFPNRNLAFFAENIFYVSEKLSITPGVRFEYIKTESDGNYRLINLNGAGNPIRDTLFLESKTFERNRLLFGLGVSYKPTYGVEFYGNISQNYRSITFNDIRVVNPTFIVDPNITDENGFTADLGARGRINDFITYDINVFGLLYNDRLGEVLRPETRTNADGEQEETGRLVRFRGNIGKAIFYGLESLLDVNLLKVAKIENTDFRLEWFSNLAITQSEYLESEIAGVESSEVEFVPNINLKTGIKMGYKNFLAEVLFSHLSSQFSDATNAPENINEPSGTVGEIPSYSVLDLSLSYSLGAFRFEAGVNNLLDEQYFTQRATGYPGPGIIPAMPRGYYGGVQVKF